MTIQIPSSYRYFIPGKELLCMNQNRKVFMQCYRAISSVLKHIRPHGFTLIQLNFNRNNLEF